MDVTTIVIPILLLLVVFYIFSLSGRKTIKVAPLSVPAKGTTEAYRGGAASPQSSVAGTRDHRSNTSLDPSNPMNMMLYADVLFDEDKPANPQRAQATSEDYGASDDTARTSAPVSAPAAPAPSPSVDTSSYDSGGSYDSGSSDSGGSFD